VYTDALKVMNVRGNTVKKPKDYPAAEYFRPFSIQLLGKFNDTEKLLK
jgi:hypothetical protein